MTVLVWPNGPCYYGEDFERVVGNSGDAMAAERATRSAADEALGTRIDGEATTRATADASEATTRAAADAALGARIAALEGA